MRVRAFFALVGAGLLMLVAGPALSASAAPYPPSTCPTLSISTTEPQVGDSITVGGSSFAPNATIRLELHSATYTLATVKSDSAGAFSTSVTLPAGVVGNHEIVAIGGGSSAAAGCPVDPSQSLTIQGSGIAATSASSGTDAASTGGTAFTGVNALLLLVVALALIGVGVAVNRRGKARVHQ